MYLTVICMKQLLQFNFFLTMNLKYGIDFSTRDEIQFFNTSHQMRAILTSTAIYRQANSMHVSNIFPVYYNVPIYRYQLIFLYLSQGKNYIGGGVLTMSTALPPSRHCTPPIRHTRDTPRAQMERRNKAIIHVIRSKRLRR